MNKIITFILIASFAYSPLYAQMTERSGKKMAQNANTWKKTILRSVYIYDTTRYNDFDLKKWINIPDTTFAGTVSAMVFNGQLHAYILEGDQLKDKLSIKKLTDLMKFNNFSFYLVDKYRLLEEWTYDPVGLTTTIRILAVAPVLAVFDDNGAYRGPVSMYWLKYTDVKDIIENFETKHHNKQITNAIMRNYSIGTDYQ